MRRVLSLVIAALPALALGQSAGGVVVKTNSNSNLSVVNVAQCGGSSQNTDVGVSDDVTASITWTIAPAPNTSFATSGVYKIWMSTAKPAAGQQNNAGAVQTSCATDLGGTAITHQQLSGDVAVSSQTATVTSISLQTLVQAAGVTSCNSDATFYLCVQQINGSTEQGYAVVALSLDGTLPPAPTQVAVTPGDSTLHVSCHAGSGDTSTAGTYQAKATPRTAGLVPKFSGENASCSNLQISGLTNGETYDVVAYRLDDNHNPSPASSPAIAGTPIPTHDYWDQCQIDGCPEKGGCATGGLAAGLAGALSMLIAFRRRKS